MKLYSLKTKFLFLISISLMSVGLLVSIGIYGYYQFHKASYIQSVKSQLRASIDIQTQKILLSYLVPEQKMGLQLILDKYRKDEALFHSKVIENNELPENFAHCSLGSSLTECVSDDQSFIALFVPIKSNNQNYAYYFKSKKVLYDDVVISGYLVSFFGILAVLLLTFLVLFFIIARIVSMEIPQALNQVVDWIEAILQEGSAPITPPRFKIIEFVMLGDKIRKIIERYNQDRKKLLELEKQTTFSNVAKQVAHDIRSPLAALAVESNSLKELPEERRVCIVRAIQRINDIANDLILKGTQDNLLVKDPQKSALHLISSLTESLVSEKRIQFRSHLDKEILFVLDSTSYGLFVTVDPKEYKRVLSNLIDNAIEAIEVQGIVSIRIEGKEKIIKVSIHDNGKGIPEHLLKQLAQKGITYGKKQGLGLGLYHASQSVRSWGGSLDIHSTFGKETTATIRLPRQKAPDWFVPAIKIHPGDTIVILDDDQTIHQIWKERFRTFAEQNLKVLHFLTYEEISKGLKQLLPNRNIVYLFDYELLGQPVNGLQIIEEFKVKNNAILVTSHFENPEILNKCRPLNVKLIPKGMAGFVPIQLEKAEQGVDCILIDNDEMMRTTWEQAAKVVGKKILTFESPKDFFNVMNRIDKQTTIYIDSDLSNKLRGEEVAQDIYKKGFEIVYLTTGVHPSEFQPNPYLKGIIGKVPPFLALG